MYWVNFIIGGRRPYFRSHSSPYLTLQKAKEAVEFTVRNEEVLISYIQEQVGDELKVVSITPYVNSLGIIEK